MAKRSIPEQYLAIAPIYPKWQRAIAATRRAISDVEAGSDNWMSIKRAKDRLYKLVDQAAMHSPASYKEPALELLYAEIKELPSIEQATERGRVLREKEQLQEIKRLREKELEMQRSYEWMRR